MSKQVEAKRDGVIDQKYYNGHLTINRASFPSILIICSTNTFESKFSFIE